MGWGEAGKYFFILLLTTAALLKDCQNHILVTVIGDFSRAVTLPGNLRCRGEDVDCFETFHALKWVLLC